MTATLIRDEQGWEYPGGSCRLLVWEETDSGEPFVLAVVSQDEATPGMSATNAMDHIAAALAGECGSDVQIVQHNLTPLRHEMWDIGISEDGQPVWYDTTAQELADGLGLDTSALLTLLEG